MFLDQKEFSLIFSKDSSVAESFIEDLLNNRDPKFIIYFLNFINNFGRDAPEKVVSFFNKYYQDTENINCKVINIFLNFIFDTHYNYGENLLPLIKKYFECEQEYDKIFDITRKAIKNDLNQRTIHELLNLFYLKIKELEFRDFYLKNITNILKETNRIIELENFLTTIYNEIKIYWIVEKLVDIYSSKEEYEKLTNIFVGMITSGEFAKAWAESLGIIDTTIEKIIDKQNVIPKIILHLQSINSLLEKSPKNVYKIYKGIIEYLENLNENDRNEFLKSFYNFIDISNTNNILTDEQIINIAINVIEKSYSLQILEKITEILNDKTEIIIEKILDKSINKKENLSQISELVSTKYKKIKHETLTKFLNSIALDEWIKIYELNINFIKDINDEILSKLTPQSKDNILNLLVMKKEFQELEEKTNIILKNIDSNQIDLLSDLSKFVIKLISENYVYILYNIIQFISYPEFIWFIYEKLKSKIDKDRISRLFMGIFLFYMNTEQDIDQILLENFKRELLEMVKSG